MTLDTGQFIGEGSNWKIYRIDDKSETIIIRIPKMNMGSRIDNYINNYKTVNSAGMPTLNRVEKDTDNTTEFVITEDLNNQQKRIYVSPNSVISDEMKLLSQIRKMPSDSEKEMRDGPDAEKHRLINKLDQVIDFDLFLKTAENDVRKTSNLGIHVSFDAYFFGTEMHSVCSNTDYKIVDFDHIKTTAKKNTNALYKLNIGEFKNAVRQFLSYFVNDSEQKDIYIKAIENL